MTTRFMRASLELHSVVYDHLFWNYPIMWSPHRADSPFYLAPRKNVKSRKCTRKKFPLVSVVVFILILLVIVNTVAFFREFFKNDRYFPFVQSLYGVFSTVCTLFALYGRCFLYRNFGSELMSAMNGIIKIRKALIRRSGKNQPEGFDFVGAFLFASIGLLSFSPYFIATVLMYFRWDHTRLFLDFILPPSVSQNHANPFHIFFYWILRPLITFIWMFEACRILCFMFNCFAIGTQLVLQSLNSLDTSHKKDINYLRKTYKSMELSLTRFHPTQGEGASFLMFIGILVFVLCLQILILLKQFVNTIMIVFFSACAVMIIILVEVNFPYFALCHEASGQLKQKWATLKSFWNCSQGLSNRIIRSFHPLSMHTSLFQNPLFVFRKSTRTTYYYTMLDFSINLMLFLTGFLGCNVTTGRCSNIKAIGDVLSS